MDRQQVIQKKLEDSGISGTAVIPNINADQDWIRYLSEMKKGFHEKIQKTFL
jgi:hypothetical protein